MYPIIKPLLFMLDPETAHDVTFKSLSLLKASHLAPLFFSKLPSKPKQVMGLTFPNVVGLAAGLDKNADYLEALSPLGFGFIEVGTLTPKPQSGNPTPRLFRLKQAQAIINRMGFNNKGVDYAVEQLKSRQYQGILGINIGKNKTTPNDQAIDDYLYCMDRIYALADYITINLSSPNTPGLRDLQFGDPLRQLLAQLKIRQNKLTVIHNKKVPIAVKVAPDMADDDIEDVANALLENDIEGLIATNTTITRPIAQNLPYANETGGLSGKPLAEKSTAVIGAFKEKLAGKIPIIGVGGIDSVDSAQAKLDAGADLVQIYTGLIFQGPWLVNKLIKGIE